MTLGVFGVVDLRRRAFDSGGPSVADLGEQALLVALVAAAAEAMPDGAEGVIVGAGDDAAVFAPPPGMAIVQSQDALVEHRDFRRRWSTPYQLGRRALSVGLSDLAAMGARPHSWMATVCAPATTAAADLLAIQLGLLECGRDVGCAPMGGDLSETEGPLVIDVCVTGLVAPDALLRRDAGREGDLLAVTGRLGRAAAGLRVLEGRHPLVGGAEDADLWMSAQLLPVPRLVEGQRLASAGVRCGGDLSDGIIVDAQRTAAASRCGAELWRDAMPVDESLRAALGTETDALVLGGGEDFELLVAAPADILLDLASTWPLELAPLTIVGRFVSGSGLSLLSGRGGAPLPIPIPSSRHFA